MSVGILLSYQMCSQGPIFSSFVIVSVFRVRVRRQRGLKTTFIPSDYKSEKWKKIGNVNLVSCNQIFEETTRTQDPVQFIDM